MEEYAVITFRLTRFEDLNIVAGISGRDDDVLRAGRDIKIATRLRGQGI